MASISDFMYLYLHFSRWTKETRCRHTAFISRWRLNAGDSRQKMSMNGWMDEWMDEWKDAYYRAPTRKLLATTQTRLINGASPGVKPLASP